MRSLTGSDLRLRSFELDTGTVRNLVWSLHCSLAGPRTRFDHPRRGCTAINDPPQIRPIAESQTRGSRSRLPIALYGRSRVDTIPRRPRQWRGERVYRSRDRSQPLHGSVRSCLGGRKTRRCRESRASRKFPPWRDGFQIPSRLVRSAFLGALAPLGSKRLKLDLHQGFSDSSMATRLEPRNRNSSLRPRRDLSGSWSSSTLPPPPSCRASSETCNRLFQE